jgi:ubiquinone/menaquinone biosynthesis C-methylase UbiE
MTDKHPDLVCDTDADVLAAGQDREALRFTVFSADRLVFRLAPRPGEKILDAGTGTGTAALAAAQAVKPGGRVAAIDSSEEMLRRLEAKLAKFGIANIDVHVMDATHLDFRRDYFHHVVSSLALFRFSDPAAALREWKRVTRPGGNVMFSTFASRAFEPLLTLLCERVRDEGGEAHLPWEQMSNAYTLEVLMREAGFVDIEIREEQLGYHLESALQWWEIVEHSAIRHILDTVSPPLIEQIRVAHMTEIESFVTQDGLWLNMPIIIVRGRKPLARAG